MSNGLFYCRDSTFQFQNQRRKSDFVHLINFLSCRFGVLSLPADIGDIAPRVLSLSCCPRWTFPAGLAFVHWVVHFFVIAAGKRNETSSRCVTSTTMTPASINLALCPSIGVSISMAATVEPSRPSTPLMTDLPACSLLLSSE